MARRLFLTANHDWVEYILPTKASLLHMGGFLGYPDRWEPIWQKFWAISSLTFGAWDGRDGVQWDDGPHDGSYMSYTMISRETRNRSWSIACWVPSFMSGRVLRMQVVCGVRICKTMNISCGVLIGIWVGGWISLVATCGVGASGAVETWQILTDFSLSQSKTKKQFWRGMLKCSNPENKLFNWYAL